MRRRLTFLLSILLLLFHSQAFAFDQIRTESNFPAISNLVTHESGVWRSGPDPSEQRIGDLLKCNRINSLDDYCLWLQKNFSYQKGPTPERWLKPEEIFNRQTGDCKDYSMLNFAVLKVLGYQPFLLAIENPEDGHAICAFMYNGRYAFFNNGELVVTQTDLFSDFKACLFRYTRFIKLMEINPQTKQTSLIAIA